MAKITHQYEQAEPTDMEACDLGAGLSGEVARTQRRLLPLAARITV